ncbi:AEC family transporter [Thauera sp. SDU_THAU2]|uniref:AEC family transporter n=1 Tax=Thauera sp. SDU_THAU2 TaxID=3136633 RepID=UPI00311D5BC9
MLSSIVPVFLIILLGVAIRRYQWMSAEFFPVVERFSYNVAFPAMLFLATAKLDFQGGEVGLLALATLAPTALILVLTMVGLRRASALPDAARSSVIQGAVRPNTYFGVAVSALFFEPHTASLVLLALALCLPAVNVVAVVALSWWSGRKRSLRTIALTLLRNPIILSVAAGMAWSEAGLPLPATMASTLDIIGRSALCLGLICVGGGLVFTREGLRPVALAVTAALKLIAMPLAAAVLCRVLGLPTPLALAACFYCALPTAPNAYIMARQMGGDAQLMATMITTQTMLALLTVPLSLKYLD